MRQVIAILIMSIAVVSNVSAWCGPFEINNETFFDGDWSVVDKHGIPDADTVTSRYISGWIDIVGFREMVVLDGVAYVNGPAKEFAIIKHDAWSHLLYGTLVSFGTTIDVYDANMSTVATQDSVLKWKRKSCRTKTVDGKKVRKCKWKYKTNTLHIEDVEKSPETFDNNISNLVITITSYNNSVTPYTLIHIPRRWNIIKEKVEYKGNSTTWNHLTGWVTNNSKGTEYVKFIAHSFQERDPTYTVDRTAELYVINEAPLDWALLNISVFTPYIEITDVPCNVSVLHSKPSDHIHWKIALVYIITIAFLIVVSYSALNWRRT